MSKPKSLKLSIDGNLSPQKKPMCEGFSGYLKEYTDNTSLHGVKYVGQKNRSVFERICWLFVLIISVYLCVCVIATSYKKWNHSSAIANSAKGPRPIWEIPFPAITICPQIKARQSVFNFTDFYHKIYANNENYTKEEENNFAKVALLCDGHIFNSGDKTTDYDIINYFAQVSQNFSEIFWTCVWTLNSQSKCQSLFTPVITEEGICYSFNMLDRQDIYTDKMYEMEEVMQVEKKSGWSLEEGYQNTAINDSYPRRVLSSGTRGGLLILMRAYEKDLDYICRGPVQGFKVFLHQPGEVPTMGSNFLRVPLNQEMIMAVKPNLLKTSDALRDYDPHNRGCYFDSEKELTYFRNYTQQNCEIECLTNHILHECGCVPFHMPHNESAPICGSGSTLCVFNTSQELLSSQVESGINTSDESNPFGRNICDCLPSCTTLTYTAETTQVDFEWQRLMQAYQVEDDVEGLHLSRLTVFFKENHHITWERSEMYGFIDILAKCGGLLALFLGFSFISVVEMLYFVALSIHKYCTK